jgi:hypothetical protein
MKRINIRFIPLDSREGPGDPELGGWRPLRLCFSPRRRISFLSVGEAGRVVAARLANFQLRRAIEIVARRLAISSKYESEPIKGGDV